MNRAPLLVLLLVFVVYSPAQESNSSQQAAGAQDSSRPRSGPANAALTPSQIFSRARPSVVVIVASDQEGQREALGSGFIVSHGRIATNHHVVEGMNEAYVVFSDGDVKPVSKVLGDSAQLDLIILAVETGKRSPVTFGDELLLQQGDSVYALGAPKGLELSFTNGIVSSFRKSNAQFLIQTTAPIAPGSSGGPLFDRTGRVVGVTTSLISDAPGIYFSVGIGDVKRLLRAPQSVALSLSEWAKQQATEHDSGPPNVVVPNKSQDEQAPTASLEDTLSWMQSFSKAHGIRIVDGRLTTKNLLVSLPADGCTVLVLQFYPNQVNSSRPGTLDNRSSRLRINLSDIAPESVKPDSYGNVELQSTDPSGKIVGINGLVGGGEIEGFAHTEFIAFDSIESAQRFATALKHAVTLCGGTKSPF